MLDDNIGGGLRKGNCSVVFGPPGNAKSFFAMNLLHEYQRDRSDVNCLYMPLEYSKIDHVRRALAVYIGSWGVVDEDAVKKQDILNFLQTEKNSRDWVNKLDGHIHENPTRGKLLDNGDIEIPIADFQKMIATIAEESKVRDLIILDPLTAIDPNEASRKNEWEQQKMFIRQCGTLAIENDCHMMFLSHSKKRGKHKGVETKLTMDDLAGAAALSQFVQYLFTIDYHDEINSLVYVGSGMKERFTHSRTLAIMKTNFGKGKGVKMAMDFVEDKGPKMAVYGAILPDDD